METDPDRPVEARSEVIEPRPEAQAIPHFRVSDMLVNDKEAILEHEGQHYRLRITMNHKLILTK